MAKLCIRCHISSTFLSSSIPSGKMEIFTILRHPKKSPRLWEICNLNFIRPMKPLICRCANFSEYHLHSKQVVCIRKPIGAKGLIPFFSGGLVRCLSYANEPPFYMTSRKVEHMKNNFGVEPFLVNANVASYRTISEDVPKLFVEISAAKFCHRSCRMYNISLRFISRQISVRW